jgi:hypothetical protein
MRFSIIDPSKTPGKEGYRHRLTLCPQTPHEVRVLESIIPCKATYSRKEGTVLLIKGGGDLKGKPTLKNHDNPWRLILSPRGDIFKFCTPARQLPPVLSWSGNDTTLLIKLHEPGLVPWNNKGELTKRAEHVNTEGDVANLQSRCWNYEKKIAELEQEIAAGVTDICYRDNLLHILNTPIPRVVELLNEAVHGAGGEYALKMQGDRLKVYRQKLEEL